MAVTWLKNSFDILLPYDGDYALSSTFDPIREAQKWWEMNRSNAEWCDKWIILGGGGGFHLDYLDSDKLYGIVEFRWDKTPRGKLANNMDSVTVWRDLIETQAHLRWGIFPFRPAWQNLSEEFEVAQNILNGHAPTSKFFRKLSEELFV
jgi:hypothetical protein